MTHVPSYPAQTIELKVGENVRSIPFKGLAYVFVKMLAVPQIEVEGKINKIRVIKIILSTGEAEVLITNVLRMSFKHKDFKELYFLRWPVETKEDTVKNKLLLETFTGRTSQAIKQDFYCTMYLANIVSFAKMETDEGIAVEQEQKDLKYKYETNENMLIGKLKNQLILALICDDMIIRQNILNNVLTKASRFRSPIRPRGQFLLNNP